jgi:hypothetical protein
MSKAVKIKGTNNDDVILQNSAAKENIDGKKGIDAVIYSGSFADYTIDYGKSGGGGNLKIKVINETNGVVDDIKKVEWLRFDDALFNVSKNVTHFSDATSSTINPATGNLWFGSGNNANHFNLAILNSHDIEMGLKVKLRSVANGDFQPVNVDPDATAYYEVPAGLQSATRALWNFEFVVNTGLNGSTNTLSDFTFKMAITQTTVTDAKTTVVYTLDPNTHVWGNAVAAVNPADPAASFFSGDDFAPTYPTGTVPADLWAQVATNSVNLGFGPMQNVFGPVADATQAGTQYDIQLQAYNGVELIGVVSSVIDVG